jgi:hypothetical protein
MANRPDTGAHTSLHRAELIIGDSLEPGAARKLSARQRTDLHEGLKFWLRRGKHAPDPVGCRVAISQRHRDKVDLLAQLLLYFPRVYIPDPLADYALLGDSGVHIDDLEVALDEHRTLDDLASRGTIGFFSPLEREDHDHLNAAFPLARDATIAKIVLGSLPVSDQEWERDAGESDLLPGEPGYYDLQAHFDDAQVDVATFALPGLLGAARAHVPLLPLTEMERKLTIGLVEVVGRRMAEATVTELLSRPVPFLDALSATDAIPFREDDATWHRWQRELERLVLDSTAVGRGDARLTAEILDDALRQRIDSIERRYSRSSVASRVVLEGSVMDLVSAVVALAATGKPVAGLPSGIKALLSPAYRALIRATPSGADAVLMALRPKN